MCGEETTLARAFCLIVFLFFPSPSEVLSAGTFVERGGQLTILKDEVRNTFLSALSTASTSLSLQELLVYRCALMCAQFPMLSAPSPPPGHSPTPTPPIFGMRLFADLGSLDSARTAPAEGYMDTVVSWGASLS